MLLFLGELRQHESKGFIKASVWQDLRLHVHPGVLPEETLQRFKPPIKSRFTVVIMKFLICSFHFPHKQVGNNFSRICLRVCVFEFVCLSFPAITFKLQEIETSL